MANYDKDWLSSFRNISKVRVFWDNPRILSQTYLVFMRNSSLFCGKDVIESKKDKYDKRLMH